MLKVAVPITLGEFNSRVFTQRLPERSRTEEVPAATPA
jgi:hypothetical protein